MSVVFQDVKELLKQGVRETLTTIRNEHPDEQFYAFSLYDADGDAVAPSTNSEEQYRAVIDRAGAADSNTRFLYRWGTAEWGYEAEEYGPFEEARSLLRNEPRDTGSNFRPDRSAQAFRLYKNWRTKVSSSVERMS